MVVKDDRPEFRGMIQAVRHLVTVEEVRLTWQGSQDPGTVPPRAAGPG